MEIGRLCMLFGKIRQAFYDKKQFLMERHQNEIQELNLVVRIRRELPGIGTHKLHWLMRNPLKIMA